MFSNFGSAEREFTAALKDRWKCHFVSLFNNGTFALYAGLASLPGRKGVVITTPFTFPATAHAIRLAGFGVRFADVDLNTFNINVASIEEIADNDVVGVLGVHVYGNPCDTKAIGEFCKANGWFDAYDAAHCVDVFIGGSSVFNEGVFSMVSLHATKLLHSGEGGALFTADEEVYRRTRLFMNFGISGEDSVSGVGLNGKLSEFQAAVGLSVLPYVQGEIAKRAELFDAYVDRLSRIPCISFPTFDRRVKRNFQYFPCLIEPFGKFSRDTYWSALKERGIFARRYFYPLLSDCEPYVGETNRPLPHARAAAARVLCLPIHSGVTFDDIDEIGEVAETIFAR
jgi:dTDP-4-amino-4,6-dideoxygalactose transaminase